MGNGGPKLPDYGEDVILEPLEVVCLLEMLKGAFNILNLEDPNSFDVNDETAITLRAQGTDNAHFELEIQLNDTTGNPARFNETSFYGANSMLEEKGSPFRVGPKGSFEEDQRQPIIFYVLRSAVQAEMEARSDIN